MILKSILSVFPGFPVINLLYLYSIGHEKGKSGERKIVALSIISANRTKNKQTTATTKNIVAIFLDVINGVQFFLFFLALSLPLFASPTHKPAMRVSVFPPAVIYCSHSGLILDVDHGKQRRT